MAILTVGAILFSGVVALGGLMIGGNRGLRQEIGQMRQDMAQIEVRLNKKMDDRFGVIEGQISELRERMAHLEGLLEGLREAITYTRPAS